MKRVLGIDIGGVIIKSAEAAGDTSFFSSAYLETPPVEGAIDSIKTLYEGLFDGEVYLISKCGEGVQRKTLDWLSLNRPGFVGGSNP